MTKDLSGSPFYPKNLTVFYLTRYIVDFLPRNIDIDVQLQKYQSWVKFLWPSCPQTTPVVTIKNSVCERYKKSDHVFRSLFFNKTKFWNHNQIRKSKSKLCIVGWVRCQLQRYQNWVKFPWQSHAQTMSMVIIKDSACERYKKSDHISQNLSFL